MVDLNYCKFFLFFLILFHRSSKYLLKLSPSSVEILKQYLISKSHIILFQIINCWFEFEDAGTMEDLTQENEDAANMVQVRSICGINFRSWIYFEEFTHRFHC